MSDFCVDTFDNTTTTTTDDDEEDLAVDLLQSSEGGSWRRLIRKVSAGFKPCSCFVVFFLQPTPAATIKVINNGAINRIICAPIKDKQFRAPVVLGVGGTVKNPLGIVNYSFSQVSRVTARVPGGI